MYVYDIVKYILGVVLVFVKSYRINICYEIKLKINCGWEKNYDIFKLI